MNTQHAIEGEEVVLFINEHWVKYIPPMLLAMLSWILYVLCLTLSLAINTVSHGLSVFVIVLGHFLLLALHHTAFYRFFNASTWQTLITNRRILEIHQQLWISNKVSDTPLWRVRTVEVKQQGIMQQLLGYGILVLNRGEIPTIHRVPHPHMAHARLIPYIQGMQPALEKKVFNPRSHLPLPSALSSPYSTHV
ncbi:hypothetical protein COU76_03190 [Candidatus Peregrinibacteria bacterium CG10_big_fil_rev_8_21_14_0_10_49_10]|nr:MAG: hypothetical protein COU76_03190 [Candidatus Peregrinibacteria bacterium CG10_big_fil_rev_8_21_14_0_10_49_10]